ncbi:hypothetical protein LINPERPRIM_LOCUS30432 [Linum perenne]
MRNTLCCISRSIIWTF